MELVDEQQEIAGTPYVRADLRVTSDLRVASALQLQVGPAAASTADDAHADAGRRCQPTTRAPTLPARSYDYARLARERVNELEAIVKKDIVEEGQRVFWLDTLAGLNVMMETLAWSKAFAYFAHTQVNLHGDGNGGEHEHSFAGEFVSPAYFFEHRMRSDGEVAAFGASGSETSLAQDVDSFLETRHRAGLAGYDR